jgi:hypothetical protein
MTQQSPLDDGTVYGRVQSLPRPHSTKARKRFYRERAGEVLSAFTVAFEQSGGEVSADASTVNPGS